MAFIVHKLVNGKWRWTPLSTGGGVDDGDYGDVKVSDDGSTWVIDTDSIGGGELSDSSVNEIKLKTTTEGTVGQVLSKAAVTNADEDPGLAWIDAPSSSSATKVTVSANDDVNESNRITFVADEATTTGSQDLEMDTDFHYNPSTGTVSATVFSGSGASLTTLNAANLDSGTVPTARLGSGTADNSVFLRGDNTWQAVSGFLPSTGGTLTGDITIGVNDTGYDTKLFGDTDGAYCLWDASEDDLVIAGAAGLTVSGTGVVTIPEGQLKIGSTAVTSTATELNSVDVTTPGEAQADKAVVLNSTKDITGLNDVTIAGTLTVNGTTTTVNSTNTAITDNLLELNSGATTNANDSGIIIERGSTGDNAIIAWDESEDRFTVGTTTATADSTGNIAITKGTLFADIDGNVTGSSGSCTGNADTATTATSATTATNAVNFGITNSSSADKTTYPVFVDASTGNEPGEVDTGLTYNPSTGKIIATIVEDGDGNVRSIPQNEKTDAYQLVASDAGKHILAQNTITVPNNIFAIGDAVTIVNNTAGNITITKTEGITDMYWSADGTNTDRTLATRGIATLLFTAGTAAYISGSGVS